tara:strand:- start:420 stop:863 length:444 start_codon:yes stop_codon:yes gene_type:complete
MSDSKKSMGKLYEKYEILKGHTHNLEVAIAHNDLTNQDELIIVWANPEDTDQKMPLAQLLTGTEIQQYLEPDFEKSFVLNTLFEGYSKYDSRQTVEEYDEVMLGDEDYSKMLQSFDEGVELAKALREEDGVVANLEDMLKMVEVEEE